MIVKFLIKIWTQYPNTQFFVKLCKTQKLFYAHYIMLSLQNF